MEIKEHEKGDMVESSIAVIIREHESSKNAFRHAVLHKRTQGMLYLVNAPVAATMTPGLPPAVYQKNNKAIRAKGIALVERYLHEAKKNGVTAY